VSDVGYVIYIIDGSRDVEAAGHGSLLKDLEALEGQTGTQYMVESQATQVDKPGGNVRDEIGVRRDTSVRATGVSRKVDDLGRIVLPAELRRSFDIREGDHIEISVEGDNIILAKRRTTCTFCGSLESLRQFRDRPVCGTCVSELKRF
jgi:transcriptional pleiotropic regulator of transition state genes